MFVKTPTQLLGLISSQRLFIRGKRIWVRKPLGSPIAPSKMFRIPVHPKLPEDEKAEIKRLYDNYYCEMKSLRQYFYEDACKQAESGEVAQQKLKIEGEEHARLMEENRLENERTAALREQRLKAKAEATHERILISLDKEEKMKEHYKAEFEAFIKQQQNTPFIHRDQIERAIEEALANPVDFNFAIDLEGYVYRGKETNINNIPMDKREIFSTH